VSALFSPLREEALLQISGPDAATFLQGQLTCDLREVDAHRARPGAYCNAQGRMLADCLLVQAGPEHFLLRLRASLAEATAERLAKYVVFAKAEVNVAAGWQVFACWGETIAAGLLPLVGNLPRRRYDCVAGEGFCLIQTDSAGHDLELYIDGQQRPDLLQALTEHLAASDARVWQARQIAGGIGRVESATEGEFLPQALNYDRTGFVSFTKGCYTGQEVVARLHYRGKPKRRLYLASTPPGPVPAAGQPVYASSSEQTVGTVVNAVAAADDDIHLLVSVAERFIDNPLALDREGRQTLQVSPPPYALSASD
jgi:folate-binding protein YgfZ